MPRSIGSSSAVDDVRVQGVATNASWLVRALREPDFRNGDVSTAFIAKHGEELVAPADPKVAASIASAAYTWAITPKGAVRSPWELADGFRPGRPSVVRVPLRIDERDIEVTRTTFSLMSEYGVLQQWSESGAGRADVLVRPHDISVWLDGELFAFQINDGSQFEAASSAHAGSLTTPLPGVVVSVAVKEGDTVTAGQTLLVIEAMKMEHAIKAPRAGKVKVDETSGGRSRAGRQHPRRDRVNSAGPLASCGHPLHTSVHNACTGA